MPSSARRLVRGPGGHAARASLRAETCSYSLFLARTPRARRFGALRPLCDDLVAECRYDAAIGA
jgi:hypothetical protein